MADGFDIGTPSKDRGHEAIRQAVVQAIADVGDGFSLTDVLFELLDAAMAQIDALNIRCDALQIAVHTAQSGVDVLQPAVADLTDRLAVLEPAVFTEPNPGV